MYIEKIIEAIYVLIVAIQQNNSTLLDIESRTISPTKDKNSSDFVSIVGFFFLYLIRSKNIKLIRKCNEQINSYSLLSQWMRFKKKKRVLCVANFFFRNKYSNRNSSLIES